MKTSLQSKLLLGFLVLTLIVAVVGAMIMVRLRHLGESIDVILKENYKSVIACQDMKEALERIDSGALFILAGEEAEGRHLINQNILRFTSALETERNNITLAGEKEHAQAIQMAFESFRNALSKMEGAQGMGKRHIYFGELLPLFKRIKDEAQLILEMNQENMIVAKELARRNASEAYRQMLVVILSSLVFAVLFSFFIHRWVLTPIRELTESAEEIRKGNLELVLKHEATDEIGRFSSVFNEMAAALRQFRRSDRSAAQRSRHAAKEVFKAMPEAIAILDTAGKVEITTPEMETVFHIRPGMPLRQEGPEWLKPLIEQALTTGKPAERNDLELVQIFCEGRELFWLPSVRPIRSQDPDELAGLAVVVKDLTRLRELRELKRSVIATVSHQLKTPLTALGMSIHMLFDESLGTLNERQYELLAAAQEESERLRVIIEDLLDLSRIESGKANLQVFEVSPTELARVALAEAQTEARDHGIELADQMETGLPRVMADPARLGHVFSNLISNAIRFTPAGGTITIRVLGAANGVRFEVMDKGAGIAPDILPRVFEPFFRAPGQKPGSGIGLGLAIVREIVRAHGGETGVRSTLGEGSVFYFTLPVPSEKSAQVGPASA